MTRSAYRREARVAVITLDDPPLNGIDQPMRARIAEHLARAQADPEVDAIVLIGAGALFSDGADIRAFGTPASRAEPSPHTLVASIEASAKPVIAAIHGRALGLGLEWALGCHYRIAARGAQLGLPEVKLGLLPGCGGTQRLPRLVGVESALRMIAGGAPIDADQALRVGLVDEVTDSPLHEAALAFAIRVAGAASHPTAASRPPVSPAPQDVFERARAEYAASQRGLPAPQRAIDCVQASLTLPFDEGLALERRCFDELVGGTESKALRHLFLAERAAAQIADLPADTPVDPVARVAVIGAGTMGRGIAMSCAAAGLAVSLVDANLPAVDRAMAAIGKDLASNVSKGRLTQAGADTRIARITPGDELARAADADLVIEAVFEDMTLKKQVFAQLDAIARPGAILATNTSRLDVNEIAAATARPEAVIGLHFFSPAHVMRLVEVVRAGATAPRVIASAMKAVRDIGKLPVLVGVCDGFVGNRMVAQYAREAEFLLEEGATPEQVDAALRAFGLAMGRFTMVDLAGLDIAWAGRKRNAATRPKPLRYSKVSDRLCEMGRFGQKTGAGFYRYEPGSRTPIPDPLVLELIEDCAREAGITRRAISDEEIVERTMYALINEGAKVLDEGIAQRASDIDLIYVNGYGFPRARGGPMFYADTVGLAKVLERIRGFHAAHGEIWKPAALLERLVAQGKTFSGVG